jgi:hypothetical protein
MMKIWVANSTIFCRNHIACSKSPFWLFLFLFFFSVWGFEPGVSGLLDRQSTVWATSPSPFCIISSDLWWKFVFTMDLRLVSWWLSSLALSRLPGAIHAFFFFFFFYLSHHQLKQNNTCCHFTQKLCFYSPPSWWLCMLIDNLSEDPPSRSLTLFFFRTLREKIEGRVTQMARSWVYTYKEY